MIITIFLFKKNVKRKFNFFIIFFYFFLIKTILPELQLFTLTKITKAPKEIITIKKERELEISEFAGV